MNVHLETMFIGSRLISSLYRSPIHFQLSCIYLAFPGAFYLNFIVFL